MSELRDAEARRIINEVTDVNLFVEAGAGSGKTRSLVDRVIRLVLHDGVQLSTIAAVTFTEKAAAELRDRLRAEFEKQWRKASDDERAAAADALEQLDSAAIGTLHSFAQRILTLHPIEAQLPPMIEVLDEVASSVAFEVRWSVIQRELLDDEEMAEKVLLALSAGVKLDHLRSLTRALSADWDLIEERILHEVPPQIEPPDVRPLVAEAARLAEQARDCLDPDDKFVANLQGLQSWGTQVDESTDDRDRYAILQGAGNLRFSYGKKANWPQDLEGLRAECKELQSAAAAAAAQVTEGTLRPLAYWLAQRVLRAAQERTAEGRLEFHDLLVLARHLVRSQPAVREALQRRFCHLLLDEFQDTDPIQIELAVRIAGGESAEESDWQEVDTPPGSLFVVGDPKQSIYRFRRANIGQYLQTQEWFGSDALVQLTTNFRTGKPVLDWVNSVFGELISYVEDAQPDYVPLTELVTQTGVGAPVTVLGADQHNFKAHGNADLLRSLEASDVAAAIARAKAERWTIRDADTGEWREIQYGDIAVLIPARTSLDQLEEALDRANITYRAESSSLVYQANEVHELMLAARAVADPSDQFSCAMALRSPLFACGDDDLWEWKRAGGSFTITAPTEEVGATVGPEHPVLLGLEYLRHLHDRARWMTPSEILGAIVADRRMLEVAADGPRRRDQWRRLRFVVDQARAWSEVEHGGLRAYLAWAAKQGEESSRVAEAVLPETDVDAVRIMTIHGAKGLEFPMVVMSGMTSAPRTPSGVQLLWKPDGYAVKLTKAVQTNDFDEVAPVDEQMDAHERRRLLYVAATRARDHLVVSLHRGESGPATNAVLLAEAGGVEAAGAVSFAESATTAMSSTPNRQDVEPPPEFDAFQQAMQQIRDVTRAVPAQSASGLEGTEPDIALEDGTFPRLGIAKGARDLELPPWKKGRDGAAIGRAVHGVLQAIDLATGAGLAEEAATQCLAEGVLAHTQHVAALADNALNSEIVKRAAARPHWREIYAATVLEDGQVLEGFLDLVYREDDGSLVVVDYKSDDVPAAAIPQRVEFYAHQMEAYRTMLVDATEAEVSTHLEFVTVPLGN